LSDDHFYSLIVMILLHINTEGLGIGVLILHLIIIGLTIALISVHRYVRIKINKSEKVKWDLRTGIAIIWIVFILFLLFGGILMAYLADINPLVIFLIYIIVYAILIMLLKRKANS
jgi:hypothetical protein